MNLSTDRLQGIAIVRVTETRLLYPMLSEFAAAIGAIVEDGDRRLVLDLSSVTSVDSATVGCLMDLHRQTEAAGGALRLCGVQKRVETMLEMTGARDVLKAFDDDAAAVKSLQ